MKIDLYLCLCHKKDESTVSPASEIVGILVGKHSPPPANNHRHQQRLELNWIYHEYIETVTILAQNVKDKVIMIRNCSVLNQNVRNIYVALKYIYTTFVKRKSVVQKSELDHCQFIEKQWILSDQL